MKKLKHTRFTLWVMLFLFIGLLALQTPFVLGAAQEFTNVEKYLSAKSSFAIAIGNLNGKNIE